MNAKRLSADDFGDLANRSTFKVMGTIRPPKAGGPPHVLLEDIGGSGVAIADLGPDGPQTRADAMVLVRLWNASLDHNETPEAPMVPPTDKEQWLDIPAFLRSGND
jgi:hypothetical protein